MKKLISILTLALLALPLFAQTTIRVDAPNLVASDEQFNVTFIVEGEDALSDFSWDAGANFQLVWGPQKGSSTSISIINGKRTKSSQSTFTYILLPKKTGKFTLPPATAKVKGETISSVSKAVEVVAGSSASGGQSNDGGRPDDTPERSAASGDIAQSDLFLRLSLSRTSVVVGEPITATLKLYQRVNVAGFEDAKFPTFNGFWSQEVLSPTNIEFHRENVNGNLYNAALLRSWVIIPQQAGSVTIDPAELVCLVNIRTQSAPRSIFDSFFEDDIRTIRKRILSDRHTVKVSPLPAGAPVSFGGGVGTYEISAALSKDSLKTHDAASLLVTVSGKGNVSLLSAPKVNFPPDFECYDVKVTENTDKSSGKTTGSKTFEYPFIPRSHGEFTIEPVAYSYYDVNSHKYVTLTTGPMSLKVEKGAGSDPSGGERTVQTVIGKDVRNLGSDVRFIRTELPAFSRKGSIFFGSAVFWMLVALVFIVAVASYYILEYMARRKADVVGSRNRGATKTARRKLARAGEFLSQNEYALFYEELHRALIGFISDKLNIDMADMSKENVDATLRVNGVPENLAEAFVELLSACEYARYSPDSGHEAMDAHYGNALSVISDIDTNMKKKSSGIKGVAALLAMLSAFPGALDAAESRSVDSLWNAGVDSYVQGQWKDASDTWKAIEDMGLESEDLYYNLGNAFFKDGDMAHAILYYERALKLNPSNQNAAYNLEYARSFVQDKIEPVPEFFLKVWHRRICWLVSSTTWVVLIFIFLALLLLCVLLFALAHTRAFRKLGFYAGIAFAVCTALSFSFAGKQKRDALSSDTAIVVRAVSSVKSSPSVDSSKDLFILHEGTKVKLLDSVGEWENISLSDGRQGWIRADNLEII